MGYSSVAILAQGLPLDASPGRTMEASPAYLAIPTFGVKHLTFIPFHIAIIFCRACLAVVLGACISLLPILGFSQHRRCLRKLCPLLQASMLVRGPAAAQVDRS